ncbi:transglycosylase domain-containing protein [Chryseotalea sanaruensis]|uniref:transglycosylase domain-containing protein n=1 Tax=Chryseotalea sanaruensis TaxID=2482724 RepID=UPI000F8EF680|nr:transglycosylase domain-containing protein [Chryseotalea sanaruensis]
MHSTLYHFKSFLKAWSSIIWKFSVQRYQQLRAYYSTHPKQKWLSIIAASIFGPPLLLLFIVWIQVPSKSALRNISNQLPSEVYTADSVLIGKFYIQDRTEVAYEAIAPVVLDALIATEDIRFKQHSGIDYASMGRVLIRSVIMGDESSGGGSTITQQLAKNLYPRKRFWIASMLLNKTREMITAIRIENIYSKEEIITMYLNTVSFADQTFGIESASNRFFSVPASMLQPHQAALLIGMLKATHSYNPRLFPERALTRRNVVIGQMKKYEFIDSLRADSLKRLPLSLKYSKTINQTPLAPYFKEYLRIELQRWFNEHPNEDGEVYNIYTDGLKIYTTLDSKLQRYAEKAVVQQMTEVQKQFLAHWGQDGIFKSNPAIAEDALRRTNRYKYLEEEGLTEEEILKELGKKIPTRLFSWRGDKEVLMSPIDSVKHHLQFLNAGLLAMDPQNGYVVAWVGGIDHDFFQYDHVRESTKRQVGSIFKPIVYATAVEQGIAPCDLVMANRETYIDKEGEEWTPRNSQNDYEVKYSMRGAMAYSVNTIAVKAILKAGVDNTIRLAREMGIVSELPDVPSISLGSASVSLMEMTTAYTTFANGGERVMPVLISSITDQDGNVFPALMPKEPRKKVLSDKASAITNAMLRTVVTEGTASRLRWKYGVYNMEVGGKTGTTQANADGWFMAVSPRLVIGSWVGADDPRIRFRSTELGQGASTALPITGYFLNQVVNDKQFEMIAEAKFPELEEDWKKMLDCDLYELDSTLIKKIELSAFKRDSLIEADTTAKAGESFLEQLYNRKLRMQRQQEKRDSIARANLIKIVESENETDSDDN